METRGWGTSAAAPTSAWTARRGSTAGRHKSLRPFPRCEQGEVLSCSAKRAVTWRMYSRMQSIGALVSVMGTKPSSDEPPCLICRTTETHVLKRYLLSVPCLSV